MGDGHRGGATGAVGPGSRRWGFVLRGDELDPVALAEDAERFHERFAEWGRYGISAFYASDAQEIDALCESRLVRFAVVAVFRRADLESVGVDIVPTFRTPHVTLCHADLALLVSRLLACEHKVVVNAYHVSDDESG